MTSSFYAIYYDGNTSIAHKVEVIVTPTYLEINFTEKEDTAVLWKIGDIQKETQTNKNYLRLLYGEFPSQILEVDIDDIKLLQEILPLSRLTSTSLYTKLTNSKRYILLLFLIFIAISVVSYFFVLPRLVSPIVSQISPEHEIQLGNTLYKSIMEDEVVDSSKTVLLNKFWKSMNYKTNYPVKITVTESEEVNAFALPGGNIVIYDSILGTMRTAEELAALLSHEYVHVQNRHSLQSMVSAYSGIILIQLIMGNMNANLNAVFQNAHTFAFLKYSRKLEKEADEKGMQLMFEHKIEPIGMYQLFKKLEESEKENKFGDMPEFLNNHPVIRNRLSYSKKYANSHQTNEKDQTLEELFILIKQ